jgi:hypothetical protein
MRGFTGLRFFWGSLFSALKGRRVVLLSFLSPDPLQGDNKTLPTFTTWRRTMDEKNEGHRAYWRGNELHDNPYPRNSLPGREWDKGYWDAVDEDKDRRERHCATLSDRVREPSHYQGLWHPARRYPGSVNSGSRKRRLQTSAAR